MSAGPGPDVPPQFQTFLAFDFGHKRTGVAVGNRMLRTATPQPTIRAEKLGQVAAEFDRIHNIQRAVDVGSVDAIIHPHELRPRIIETIEHHLKH